MPNAGALRATVKSGGAQNIPEQEKSGVSEDKASSLGADDARGNGWLPLPLRSLS
jgi:hypothetical protein